MKNKRRSVNRNLIFALIAYNNLDLGRLGALCDPPVTRAAISMLLSGKGGGDRLREQISGILGPTVSKFLQEASAFHGAAFSEGDGVIVEFEGQDWNSPKVIGFDAEPKPCIKKCSLMEDADLGEELAGSLIPMLTHGYAPEEEGVDVSLDAFWSANVLSLEGNVTAHQISPPTFTWPFSVAAHAQVQLSLPPESFEPGWYHITYQFYMRVPTLATDSDIEPLDLGNFNNLHAELLCGLEIDDVAEDGMSALKVRHYGNGSLWEWRQIEGEEWTFIGYENEVCGASFTVNYTGCVDVSSPEDIITFRIKALCYASLQWTTYWFNFSCSFSDFTLSVTNLSVEKIKMDVEDDGP